MESQFILKVPHNPVMLGCNLLLSEAEETLVGILMTIAKQF